MSPCRTAGGTSLRVLAMALTIPFARAESYTFVNIDVPGATSTSPTGINNSGQISGTWYDNANNSHGFLRSSDGSTFTTIDPPNAAPNSLRCNGINNLGQVVGSYRETGTNLFRGFVWRSSSGISTFDLSGLLPQNIGYLPGTDATGINDRGDIVGPLSDFATGQGGYLRTADGTLTRLQAAFLGQLAPFGINNKGEVTGTSRYGSSYGPVHGWVRSADGTYTQFDFPGTFSYTSLAGRNNFGQFVGDVQGEGFVGQPDGTVELLPGRYVNSINDSGQIVGFTSSNSGSHGFLGLPGPPSTAPTIYDYPYGTEIALGQGGNVAAGSWIEIYGRNLSPTTRSWRGSDFSGNAAPTSLDGVSVSINGVHAIVSYISPGQVNAYLPDSLSPGNAQLTVSNGGRTTAPYSIPLGATEPLLLRLPSNAYVPASYAVAVFPDFVTYTLPPTYTSVPTRRARARDTIILFGTGLGPVEPAVPSGTKPAGPSKLLAPVRVYFTASTGFAQAEVTYAGVLPGAVGLYQINLVVPDIGLPPGVFDDYVEMQVWVGEKLINTAAPILWVPVTN